MKQTIYIILYVVLAAFMIGCTGSGGTKHEPQASDTLYTWRAAMKVYGYQPERALQIIDSAVIVGNMSEVWADANRARVYSMTQMNEQMDSLLGGSKGAGLEKGKVLCEQLLKHDSLKTNLKLKQEVLDILVYTARQQQDTVNWLQRSRELVDVYHQMGPEKETDALQQKLEAERQKTMTDRANIAAAAFGIIALIVIAFAQGSPFKSVTEFINDCRLPYAAKLMTECPDLSIAEVAEASGFSRTATFIDNFKKRFALTPNQYRTQNLV